MYADFFFSPFAVIVSVHGLVYVPGIRKLLRLSRRLLVLHSAGEAADNAGQPQGLDLLPGAGALHGPLAAALQGSAQVEPGPGWNCASISPLPVRRV